MNLLDFIFPKRCVGCGSIGKYFCAVCRTNIRPIAPNEAICPMCGRLALDGITHPRCRTPYSLDGLTSFFHYDGSVRKAIKAIKYRLVSDLANEFISFIPDVDLPKGVLIPIPLHSSRFRYRGFNQAEVLGSLLRIRMRTDILRRTRATVPQVEMKDKKKRLANMQNVFSIHHSSFTIHNSSILLFDDVFTTGATMRSAGSMLKHAGAKRVWAVTMAR
jgi:ComF family protein